MLLICFGANNAFAQSLHEQEVLKAERDWLNAYEQHDTTAMDRLVAEGFIIRYAHGGTETKTDLLNMLKRNISSGSVAKNRFYTEETTAKVYAGTVV